MVCKGICTKYKAIKPMTGSRYGNGQKRCQICEIFMDVGADLFCPCCGYRLRTKPRNGKDKESLRKSKIA
jgi:rRNA maturation endonuclease Nob1